MRWLRFVVFGKYPSRWQDRIFQGHVNLGRRITIYGANAMHWAVNVWFRDNWWCFHWPTRTFGGRWPWYFYISRDATPHAMVASWGEHRRDFLDEQQSRSLAPSKGEP